MKANLIVLKLGVKRINRFYIELPYCIIRVSKSIKEHQRASHTHHLFKMILDLIFNFLFTTIQRTRDSKEERKKIV